MCYLFKPVCIYLSICFFHRYIDGNMCRRQNVWMRNASISISLIATRLKVAFVTPIRCGELDFMACICHAKPPNMCSHMMGICNFLKMSWYHVFSIHVFITHLLHEFWMNVVIYISYNLHNKANTESLLQDYFTSGSLHSMTSRI